MCLRIEQINRQAGTLIQTDACDLQMEGKRVDLHFRVLKNRAGKWEIDSIIIIRN